MIAGLHFNSEIRSFKRHKLTKVALIAIVLMPLLYSALYLWAFWDPFDKVNDLPVALVNSDQGTEVNGKKLNAGDEVVKGLQLAEVAGVEEDPAAFGQTEFNSRAGALRERAVFDPVRCVEDLDVRYPAVRQRSSHAGGDDPDSGSVPVGGLAERVE